MYCSKCGAVIPDDSAFCSTCGATLSSSTEQATSQPATSLAQTVPVIMVTQPNPATTVRSNGAGVAGLVFGILSLCLGWIPYIGWIFVLLGLIFSIVGLAKRNATKGAAIAGLILSIIGVFIGSVLVLGINSYLKKANAAASSAARQTSDTANFDVVNAEIDRVL